MMGWKTLRVLILAALAFAALFFIHPVVRLLETGLSGKVLPSVVLGLVSSTSVIIAAVWFLFVYAGLHIALACLWCWVWQPIGGSMSTDEDGRWRAALLSFLPVLFLLFLTNSLLFPYSVAALSAGDGAGRTVLWVLWWSAVVYISTVVVIAAWRSRRRWVIGASVVAAFGGLVAGKELMDSGAQMAPARSSPDVIIVGIDGLRVDHIGFLQGHDDSLTSQLDSILAGSAVLSDAWTPLARTFPAWVSVLTGTYPGTSGAIYNLIPRDMVDDEGSLAHLLGQLGYRRIYAIDETRFSNIDETFGFDEIVGPPIGAFDFLVGGIGDLPIVNLVGATDLGRWAFPYVHMNRGISHSYRPVHFERALARAVRRVDPQRPMFLVAHFELPHWPYSWSTPAAVQLDDGHPLHGLSAPEYLATIAEADRQLGALFGVLESTRRLDNAIVVILTDHGEAFVQSESRWRSASAGGGVVLPHAGHGSNVFSENQYRVLMAFRGYGQAAGAVRAGVVGTVTASLVDIRPTVQQWLGIAADETVAVDGMSLLPLLSGIDEGLADRAVALESGFSLPSIEAGNPDAAEMVTQGARFYRISRGGRLTMDPTWLPMLRTQKQRAVVNTPWILGVFPKDASGGAWSVMLGRLDTQEYWNLDRHAPVPADAPLHALKAEFCRRYGADPMARIGFCTDPD